MPKWEYTPVAAGNAKRAPEGPETPALFFALREPWYYLKTLAFGLLLFSPLAFFMPAAFLVFAAGSALSAYANARAFKFELSATHLRIRHTWMSRLARIPLAEIDEASAIGVRAGTGVLALKLKKGGILVPGLREVEDAAAAVRQLQGERRRDAWRGHAA